MANFNNQYDYGLVPVSKFGSGSFYTPYNTSRQKALRIDPVGAGNFDIQSGQDFYISVWIKYGTANVRYVGQSYPIIKYGQQSSFGGWEIGIGTYRVGDGNSPLPYFAWVDTNTGQSQRLTTYFNGSNGNFIQPTGNFDHYEVFRRNGIIYFRFNGVNSSNTSQAYTGALGPPNATLVAQGTIQPDYAGIFVGSEQPYVAGQDNGAYIDDLFFARGVSAVQNYNQDGSINDGKLTTTVLLYQFNGNIVDTVGMTQVADAIQLVSYSTFTARATEQFVDQAHLTSTFTLTATTTNVPKVRLFEAHLNSTSSLQAYPIKPVGSQGQFYVTSTLTATPVRYYPRPNGTWDSNIESQYTWTNWQDLYIDRLPASYEGTLVDFNNKFKIVTTRNSANALYWTITYDGTNYIQPIINYSQHPYVNLRLTRNSGQIVLTDSSTGSSSNLTSTGNLSGVLSYNVNFDPTYSSTQVLTTINDPGPGNFTLSANISMPPGGSGSFGTLLTNRTRSINYTSTSWYVNQYNIWTIYISAPGLYILTGNTYYGIPNKITAVRSGTSLTFNAYYNSTQLATSGSITVGSTDYFTGGLITGSHQEYVSQQGQGYLQVASQASNLLLTRTGFNYGSTVISTNPYVVNNQTQILGLYDAYGSADRTGFISTFQANLISQSVFTVQATKVIVARSLLTSQTQLTVNLTKQVRTGAQLQSTASWQATTTKGLFGVSRLTTQSTLSATAKKYSGTTANLIARSTVTLTPYNFTKYQAQLQVSTQLTGISLRIKQLQSQLQALASEVIAVARIRHGETYLESRSTLTAQATIRNNPYLPLTATSSLTASGRRIRYADAHLQVSSTAVVNNGHLRYADAQLQVSSSLSLTPIRIRPGKANLQAQATETTHTENSRKPGTTARLSSTTRLTSTNQIVRLGQAHLNATSTMYGTAGVVIFGYCSWQALSSELILGRLIDIDPFTTIQIKQESRGLIVLPESRIISIKQETRVNIIKDTL